MLVTYIFSFSDNVLTSFNENILQKAEFILSPHAFNPDKSKILSFSGICCLLHVTSFRFLSNQNIYGWKKTCPILNHYYTIPHFDALKIYNCRKHCEKRRNCLSQAISPFLAMFSTCMTLIFHFECTLILSQTTPGFYVSAG